jgi:lipopolysaccharide biosynthesis glycosyltransferase
MKQPSYLVFLCFGEEGFFYECAFALLSLSRLYKPGELPCDEIWVYTDNPGWFSRFKDCPLPFHFREITAQEIKQWQQPINYIYRVKIEVLRDFTSNKTGNVIYFDTDIVFTHPIDKMVNDIGGGKVYMHSTDGIVSSKATPMLRKLDNHLRKGNFKNINGQPMYELTMWNSGVIGFNTKSGNHTSRALQLLDTVYPSNHSIRVVEQFAFSVAFHEQGNILSALPYTLHYWNLKEARVILASFFSYFKDSSWQELVKYSGTIHMFELMMEKVRFNNKRDFLEKLVDKKWKPGAVNWDEVKKQN